MSKVYYQLNYTRTPKECQVVRSQEASASIFAKADPLGNQRSHDILTVAFDAAIRKYWNHNGDLSNHEGD